MEWKEISLGDVCSIVGRIGFRGYTIEDFVDSKEYGAISLSPTNIVNGELDLGKCSYINWKKYEESPEIMLKAGDVVIVKTGSSVGRTAYIREVVHPMTLNPQFVVLKDIAIDSEYLSYYVKSNTFQGHLKSIVVGSAIPTLSQKNLAKLKIRQPVYVSDQRRIASILSSLDRKIELNNKINAQLEEMAQALFKEWFVDFGPFKDGKFVESELGLIPEGWRVGTLGEIAEINPRRILKKDVEATYLDMKNMPTNGPFPNGWDKKLVNGGMRFKNGDTLMARITPCLENGKVSYVNFLKDDEVGFGSTEYIVMTPNEYMFPEFFYFLCRDYDFVGYATRNMNGSSGRQRVSGDVIGIYKLVIPPYEVINKIASVFESIMNQIREHGFENLHLSQLRDTLLPKLMKGEINLDEYEC